ncbi:protein Skeletor, isoforms B/C-like isoform X2 [Daphnia carinata]|uniref:protein Skeletor, isoforms B/C-like isoform X2 n=1 Tax=Daphnia carinata TaxID=120202 RepID=UPI0028687AD3|nr:protein Skeletor, isoforms B/C-like isoform X2 [Daphnia carinata]
MPLRSIYIVLLAATFACCWAQKAEMSKYGRYIGDLARDVSGQVYAVSDDVLFIKGFVYGGTGPDAYFWAGNSSRPNPVGIVIPYPADYLEKEAPVLGRYDNKDILLKLPLGVKVRDLRWLSVWCRRFAVDFGSVQFPVDLDPPKPRVLSEFKRLGHGLRSGSVTILDAKTFYIPNLHYDGAAPDAYFWVGTGTVPNAQGIKVPNELGDTNVLRGYQGEDIEIQLPGDLTVHDIDWLSLWCIAFRENFGHVMIPKDLDVPPALGQNQLTTTKIPSETGGSGATIGEGHEFDSCIQLLNGRMQVQWEAILEGIIIRLSARMDENEYMSFGISGAEGRTKMIGADVAVAYFNSEDNKFYAEDYILNAKSQCDGNNGVCPDSRIGGRNDVSMLYGQRINGVTTVAYQRSLDAQQDKFDQVIPPVGRVNVIAAIGPLNSRKEANYHSSDRTGPQDDHRIDFTSRGVNQCPVLLAPDDKTKQHGSGGSSSSGTSTENAIQPWKPNVISGKTELRARIGPTGGKKGYTAITGQPSWGIAWYINDLLIPEIYVEKGETYTFLVEGGNDPTNSARYHPLYITDNLEGGFGQKTDAQQREQRIFAGVQFDSSGFPFPTAARSLCEWKHKTVDKWTESETFEDYKQTLILECESDREQPANLTWTVPLNAPNTLYYQCYTHNSLGWKINVVDRGFQPPKARGGASSLVELQISSLAVLVLPLSVLFL